MDVAISGSTGLIGTALRKALEKRGDTVRPIVRRAPAPGEIGWDIPGRRIDVERLAGVDAVVHLSGESLGNARWSDSQKRVIEQSRIDSTELLAGAVAELSDPPAVMLSGSAVGFYGDRGVEKLTERSHAGTGYLADLVVRWEAATAAAEQAGTRVAHLRSGIVLSADGGAVGEVLPFFKLGLGGRIGDGNQYWSWISLHDEVGAILHLLDNQVSGPVNLTGPNPVSNSHYTRALGRALGRPTFLPTPTLALYARLGREATKEMLLAGQRVLPAVLVDSGYVFRHESIEEAFEEIFD